MRRIKLYILLVLLISNYNCNYDIQNIIKDKNIRQRIVYSLNTKHSSYLKKEKLFLDYFDEFGYLIKRIYYSNPDLYRIYEYDMIGKLILEKVYNEMLKKYLKSEICYVYDDSGNLVYKGNKHTIPKYKALYFDNNKIKTLILYDRKGKYSEVLSFSYDWKGDLNEKIQVIYKDYRPPALSKIQFEYNMFGRLQTKKIFTRKLTAKPIIQNNKLFITEPLDDEYNIKKNYEYKYNDDNLLEEEISYARDGYVLEKLIYEYH